jgi:hypothetical protein
VTRTSRVDSRRPESSRAPSRQRHSSVTPLALGGAARLWPLTHVGTYEGECAANVLGEPLEANYEAVPRVVYTDPSRRGRRDRGPLPGERSGFGGGEDRQPFPTFSEISVATLKSLREEIAAGRG